MRKSISIVRKGTYKMCKEFKEDPKIVKNLRDRGRQENENTANSALGFVGDDDYDGALLVDEGVVHSKEWVIDSNCSFHICYEKRNLLSLVYVIMALLLYQMMKR